MQLSRGVARAVRLPARGAAGRRITAVTRAGAKAGDWAQVQYTGMLDDGTVFDTSRKPGRQPLEFIIGGGKVIKGFDLAVTGLAVGGTRKERVEPKDAYGELNPAMMMKVPTSSGPANLKPGDQVQLSNGMVATISARDDKEVTLDLNPPLAGKALTFDVELVKLCPSEKLQTATFACGCFWSPELAYQRVPGVLSTEVGYSNGQADNPTYQEVCSGTTGHAEVVQVKYDPSEVSYEELLEVFWNKHDPTTANRQGNDVGTQYRSGIYYHTAEQKEIAKKSMEKAQERFKAPIVTELAEVSKYTAAEPHHQMYLARGVGGSPQNPAKNCKDPIRCYG